MSLKAFMRVLTIVGIVIVLAFLCLAHGRCYNEGGQPTAETVGFVIMCIEVLWVVVGGILLIARWKATTVTFRIVFAVNLFLAAGSVTSVFIFGFAGRARSGCGG